MCGRILQWLISNPIQIINQSIFYFSVLCEKGHCLIFYYCFAWLCFKNVWSNYTVYSSHFSACPVHVFTSLYISLKQLSSCNLFLVDNYIILLQIVHKEHHGTIRRLGWWERIIEIHYGDFLIFVSLIYFCFLYLFFSFPFFAYGSCRSRTKR